MRRGTRRAWRANAVVAVLAPNSYVHSLVEGATSLWVTWSILRVRNAAIHALCWSTTVALHVTAPQWLGAAIYQECLILQGTTHLHCRRGTQVKSHGRSSVTKCILCGSAPLAVQSHGRSSVTKCILCGSNVQCSVAHLCGR